MNRHFFTLYAAISFIACNDVQQADKTTQADKSTAAIGCATPATTDQEWYTSGKKAPLFKDLGGIHFNITTASKEAQQYFNQGMMLAYGFNHAEAARSFYEATRLDSTCAMAYWGYAYVLGPNYNGGMEADNYQRAYAAAVKAKSLSRTVHRRRKHSSKLWVPGTHRNHRPTASRWISPIRLL